MGGGTAMISEAWSYLSLRFTRKCAPPPSIELIDTALRLAHDVGFAAPHNPALLSDCEDVFGRIDLVELQRIDHRSNTANQQAMAEILGVLLDCLVDNGWKPPRRRRPSRVVALWKAVATTELWKGLTKW